MAKVEEKVDKLEQALIDFTKRTNMAFDRADKRIQAIENNLDRLEAYMKESHKRFDEDLRKSREDFNERMVEYDERLKKSDERFEKSLEESRKEFNKKWGDLARKMGTVVEDIFYPSFEVMIEKYWHCKPFDMSIRHKIRKANEEMEIDVIGYCKDKAFVLEVKSSPRTEDIEEFTKKLKRLSDFLPEIKDYKLIPLFGSFTLPESIRNSLTKRGIYGVEVKGDILEISNFGSIGSRGKHY